MSHNIAEQKTTQQNGSNKLGINSPEIQRQQTQKNILYVTNFARTISRKQFQSFFLPFGKILDISIFSSTKIAIPYAFVQFDDLRDAVAAKNKLSNQLILGYYLKIQYKKPRDKFAMNPVPNDLIQYSRKFTSQSKAPSPLIRTIYPTKQQNSQNIPTKKQVNVKLQDQNINKIQKQQQRFNKQNNKISDNLNDEKKKESQNDMKNNVSQKQISEEKVQQIQKDKKITDFISPQNMNMGQINQQQKSSIQIVMSTRSPHKLKNSNNKNTYRTSIDRYHRKRNHRFDQSSSYYSQSSSYYSSQSGNRRSRNKRYHKHSNNKKSSHSNKYKKQNNQSRYRDNSNERKKYEKQKMYERSNGKINEYQQHRKKNRDHKYENEKNRQKNQDLKKHHSEQSLEENKYLLKTQQINQKGNIYAQKPAFDLLTEQSKKMKISMPQQPNSWQLQSQISNLFKIIERQASQIAQLESTTRYLIKQMSTLKSKQETLKNEQFIQNSQNRFINNVSQKK